MKEKSLLRKALHFVSVPTCISCKERLNLDDIALCSKCYREYLNLLERDCSRCGKGLAYCSCSNFFMEKHFIKRLYKVARYDSTHPNSPISRLIFSVKENNRWDSLEFVSDEISEALKHSIDFTDKERFVIVNVPRRKSAIIKFGYDHSKTLAKRISKKLNVKYMDLLKNKARKAQKEMSGAERFLNAKIDYKFRTKADLSGKQVILIDDIVTSGSSMCASAVLLRGLGAKGIIGASYAIAYKDSYEPPEKR